MNLNLDHFVTCHHVRHFICFVSYRTQLRVVISVFIFHGLYSSFISTATDPLGMYYNIHFIDEETDTL